MSGAGLNPQELHEVISAALNTQWSAEQRAILENVGDVESVYDTVSRVEDAMSALDSPHESGKDLLRRGRARDVISVGSRQFSP